MAATYISMWSLISFVANNIWLALCPLQHIHLVIVLLMLKLLPWLLFNLTFDMYFFHPFFTCRSLIHFDCKYVFCGYYYIFRKPNLAGISMSLENLGRRELDEKTFKEAVIQLSEVTPGGEPWGGVPHGLLNLFQSKKGDALGRSWANPKTHCALWKSGCDPCS